MADTYTNLTFHIVFSTKNRIPLIHPAIEEALYKYIGGIIRGEDGVLLSIGGMPDHIHLAIKLKPHKNISDLVKRIKINSSKWINQRNMNYGKFFWQRGYSAFAVSESQLEILIGYIKNQKAHHRKKTFKEEFMGFLKKQKIKFNSQYIWE